MKDIILAIQCTKTRSLQMSSIGFIMREGGQNIKNEVYEFLDIVTDV